MAENKTYFIIGMIVLLLISLNQNTIMVTSQQSIIDNLLPDASNLEKQIIFWGGLVAISLILVSLLYHNPKK